jgi:hypothetical protein
MQIKIKPQTGLFLLTLLFLSTIPLTAEALEVKFCVPNCGADNPTDVAANTQGPGTPNTDATGVTTNTLLIPSFVYKGFTISMTAVAQQSGTLQKITFNPTTITAPSSCGTGVSPSPAPCQIEIIATSQTSPLCGDPIPSTSPGQGCDFPARKPDGGYPAGVFMAGAFTGTMATGTGNGDSISMTADATGLKDSDGTPTTGSADVINATPGGSTGDQVVSLPSKCTGTATCKFIATSLVKSFNSQISETVQQVCEPSPCLTRLSTRVNITFTNTSSTNVHKVTLPGGSVHVNPKKNPGDPPPAVTLLENSYRQFSSISWQRLFVHNSEFTVNGSFTLATQSPGVSADKEEVQLLINNLLDNTKKFELFIPQGSFKSLQGGTQFSFTGNAVGHSGNLPDATLSVTAKFTRDTIDPKKWTFDATIKGINLKKVVTPPTPPPGLTSVELILVGDSGDKGKNNVIAEIANN